MHELKASMFLTRGVFLTRQFKKSDRKILLSFLFSMNKFWYRSWASDENIIPKLCWLSPPLPSTNANFSLIEVGFPMREVDIEVCCSVKKKRISKLGVRAKNDIEVGFPTSSASLPQITMLGLREIRIGAESQPHPTLLSIIVIWGREGRRKRELSSCYFWELLWLSRQKYSPLYIRKHIGFVFLVILYHNYLWIFLIYSLYTPYIFPKYVPYNFP